MDTHDVIYVLTTDFFDSPYCLNEMGAAWVLQADYSIIITKDMDESKIDGVLSKTRTRISFKDQREQLDARMIELRDKLLSFAELPKVDDVDWSRYYNIFLNHVMSQSQSQNRPQVIMNRQPDRIIASGNGDTIIEHAIDQLGEFTLRQLQDATGIINKQLLSRKVKEMVAKGELESIGSEKRKKYRKTILSNPLF